MAPSRRGVPVSTDYSLRNHLTRTLAALMVVAVLTGVARPAAAVPAEERYVQVYAELSPEGSSMRFGIVVYNNDYSQDTVTVGYTTTNGTAAAPSDYQA